MFGGVAVEDRLVKVTARIMGEDYTIRGRAPEEHIQRVARFVDEKMIQIAEAYPKLGTSRMAVLTAINMADELFKIREQYEQLTQLLEEEWSQRHAVPSPLPGTTRTPAARPGRLPTPGLAPAAVPMARTGKGTTSGQTQFSSFEDAAAGPEEKRSASPGRRLLTGDALTPGLPARPGAASRGPEPELPEDEDQ